MRPGGNIEQVPVVVKPQSALRAPALQVHTTIINLAGQRTVTAYARFGKTVQRRLLGTHATKNERFEVTWTAGPRGLTYSGPPARRIRALKLKHSDARGRLIVGATFAKSVAVKDPAAVERRYYARVARATDTRVELLTADEEWTRFGAPIHAWLPIAVDASLQVRITKS